MPITWKQAPVPLYSSTILTTSTITSFLHSFHTGKDSAGYGVELLDGFIVPVPDAEWALSLSAEEIFRRHSEEVKKEPRVEKRMWVFQPVLVIDERSVQDGSVVVGSWEARYQSDDEDGEMKLVEGFESVRIVKEQIQSVAANIYIGNQDLETYQTTVDEDGIWRGFH
ncbi:hypothetical protein BXZ70DRAFT_1010384 [Cristinia sonorae]|uniref:DUF6924 domain-containing protein n=1 Tax=Cristinia sonorae TaxID=1940300 RepID=A0A8K0UK38_9AGAR|nr:hypothetical protein BXZ70DRAFT_1010384 [Cristinia sonorae]